MMQVKRHSDGVEIILPDEAFDENLPGSVNLTFDEAHDLAMTLAAVLKDKL